MGGVKFACSREETKIVAQIAKRAAAMALEDGVEYDHMTAMMDIEACHSNGCPLRLDALLAADDGTFGHDVYGIRRFIDRSTGELGGCFVPRLAQPQPATV